MISFEYYICQQSNPFIDEEAEDEDEADEVEGGDDDDDDNGDDQKQSSSSSRRRPRVIDDDEEDEDDSGQAQTTGISEESLHLRMEDDVNGMACLFLFLFCSRRCVSFI